VQPGRPTHGYTGPVKVSSGGHKLGICEEFVRVGMTYHKRPYSDDTNDLETCNTYSVSRLILLPCLHSLIEAVSAMGKVSILSTFTVD
jgi:alcohol oxidase